MRRQRQHPRARAGSVALALVAVCGFLTATALGGAAAPAARASTTEQSILMDDYAFIYSSPAQVEANLQQVAALGVNTIKVSMVWSLVAPDPNSTTEPNFNATDPAAYPAGAWTRYDDLVEEAGALGLHVYFQLTAPAPLWATNPNVSGHQNDWSHDVNAKLFGQFVQAVGTRYSGTYPISGSTSSSSSAATGVLSLLGDPTSTTADSSSTIPAVNMWGIWNEPNEISWLSPQILNVGGKHIYESPILERHMINAAYAALIATGHADDTILIGETASGGNTHTIPFLQTLFCLNQNYQPLTGTAASTEDCPTTGDPRTFVEENPGLFGATGWAHHPYSFNHSPATPFAGLPYDITMANLHVLGNALDNVDSAYDEPTGLPIYSTEWGYKSDPPNPLVKTSLTEQEDWLDEGWYESFLQPRLKSQAQELMYDQPPIAGKPPGSAAYWANFDSGLEFEDGAPKPAYAAFRLPIWIPKAVHGDHVRLWAEIRPFAVGRNPTAVLEYQAPGADSWTDVTKLTTTNPEGFIYTFVSLPDKGTVRLAWADAATSTIDYSRSVVIH